MALKLEIRGLRFFFLQNLLLLMQKQQITHEEGNFGGC